MKTILVIYLNGVRSSKTDRLRLKKFAFNTKDDLKVGDVITSQSYDVNMHVVKVLPEAFEYLNSSTGELSNEFTSAHQWEIRELIIQPKDKDKVYGSLIKKTT